MRAIEKFLKSDGFEFNSKYKSWDKDNVRVYFDDTDIKFVSFNNTKSRLIKWQNTIDGNMPLYGQKSLILAMTKV